MGVPGASLEMMGGLRMKQVVNFVYYVYLLYTEVARMKKEMEEELAQTVSTSGHVIHSIDSCAVDSNHYNS